MSLLTDIEGAFTKVKDKVEAILPAPWVTMFGQSAHTFAAAFLHDFEEAVKAGFTEFKTLTAPMLDVMMKAIETEAQTIAPQILSGKLSLSDAATAAVKSLGTEAATTLVPALKVAGEATLTTVFRTLATSAVAALAASPTVALASSLAGSSSGSSTQK